MRLSYYNQAHTDPGMYSFCTCHCIDGLLDPNREWSCIQCGIHNFPVLHEAKARKHEYHLHNIIILYLLWGIKGILFEKFLLIREEGTTTLQLEVVW